MGIKSTTNRLLAKLFSAVLDWRRDGEKECFRNWATPVKPLREAVVALVTTGGIHLAFEPPFVMTDPAGDACDCAPLSAGAFAVAAEVTGLEWAADGTGLSWTSVTGGAGSASVHDLVVIPHGHSTPVGLHFSLTQSPLLTPLQEYLVKWNAINQHFLAHPITPHQGHFTPPMEPGLGMDLDPEKIETQAEV